MALLEKPQDRQGTYLGYEHRNHEPSVQIRVDSRYFSGYFALDLLEVLQEMSGEKVVEPHFMTRKSDGNDNDLEL